MKKRICKRLTAVVMTLIMLFSAMTAMTVTAQGASIDSAAVGAGSMPLGDIFKGIATKGLSEIVGKIGKNVAKEYLSKAGITLFDSLLENDNEKVLSSITDLSNKLTAYYNEQKAAMDSLMNTVNEMQHQQTLQPVKDDYTHMQARFKSLINKIAWVKGQMKTDTFGDGVIDADTYSLYRDLIHDDKLEFGTMLTDLNLMASYVDGEALNIDHRNAYDLLIEANQYTCDAQSFNYSYTVEDAENMNASYHSVNEMQSELTVDFAAYATYLQMCCQCAVYESDRTPSGIDRAMSEYIDPETGSLTRLTEDMEAVNDGYQTAMEHFDGIIEATVTYGSGTYDSSMYRDFGQRVLFDTSETVYYDSAPKAWAYASKTAATLGYNQVEVTLTKDWDGTVGSLHRNLPDPCKWRSERVRKYWGTVTEYYLDTPDPAFVYTYNQSDSDALAYFAASSTNDITLDLNGHSLNENRSLLNAMTNYALFTDRSGYDYAHIIDSVGGGQLMGKNTDPNLYFFITEYQDIMVC